MKINDAVYVYRLISGERLAWHGRYHAHGPGEYEFHYFMEGQGALLINRAKYIIDGNRIYFVQPREFHSILPEAVEKPISYYAVLFRPEPGNPVDEEIVGLMGHLWHARNRALPADAKDRFFLDDLYRLSKSSSERSQKSAEHALISILYRWFDHFDSTSEDVHSGGTKNEHVERALALMMKHVREKLSSDDLAAMLGLSEEYFIRLFRHHLGMPPFQYFTRLKIEAASAVLVDNQLTISDIAYRFGFENPFHFTKVFKKCTGLSPREYRKIFFEAGKPPQTAAPLT
ncbi:MAG: AraC family transcriptional regulator [Rectinema sp.]|jgi:AraC-like DNA-binding protein|uniref:Transcriptional regulator, AraC family n=1 Tax=uncultured spirochete TaxID=156406 RepID=A0A3P3XS04_9SPIR|nr:Transcriptional regulator, AraC family [uncultured spirochete]